MRYAWIREHVDCFPVSLMCELLEVSRSGYYDSIDRPVSKRAERTAKIRDSVQQVFDENHAIYGPAKVTETLKERDELETACRNTVARAMKDLGLKSRVRKRFTPTTTQADPSEAPRTERARPPVRCGVSESKVGDRHHLPADAHRLGLLGRGRRPVQPQGGRLGDERLAGDAPGKQGAAKCNRVTTTGSR